MESDRERGGVAVTPKERATALFMPDADCPHTFHFQERWANECITCIAGAISTARREALEQAAHIVENVAHSCISEEHCDFLHAAHATAAKQIRALIDRAPASAEAPQP